MHHFYYQIHQQDGTVENFHLSVNDIDIYLNMAKEVRPKVKMLTGISIEAWNQMMPDTGFIAVAIHRDLHEVNDAAGDYVGYIEHYEL